MQIARFVVFYIVFSAIAAGQNNPVPFISQPLKPTAAVPGGSDFTLTVNGAGFVSGAVVKWNGGTAATTFVSSSQLTATISAGNVAKAGTAIVTVANPAPGGGISNVAYFPVTTPSSSLQFTEKSLGITLPATLTSALTADFNHDGKLDLAFFYRSGAGQGVTIALGNGDGTFRTPVAYQGGGPVIGDFNGDGNLDLLGTDVNGGSPPSILFGNGDGTFHAVSFILPGTAFVAGDFNEDGYLDFAGLVASNLFLALGNGDGTFQQTLIANTNSFDGIMVPADLKNDGHLDLAFAGDTGTGLLLYLGNGDGTFAAGNEVGGVALFGVADVNGDDIQDVAALTADTNGEVESYIALGNGDGTFNNGPPFSHTCPGRSVFFGDFNSDGKLDIAGSLGCILLGNGDGTFQTPGTMVNATILAVGDFNGDGRLDLLDLNSSNNLQIAVQTPGVQSGDFTIVGSPSSLTISSGQTANYSVTLSPTYGFNGTVMLAYSGCPAGSNCTISPSSVTLTAGNAATATISILTTATSAGLIRPLGRRSGEVFVGWLGLTGILGILLVPGKGFSRTRQTATYSVLFFCLFSVALTMSACGGGGSSGGGAGTAPGTYTVTVTGTYRSGSVTIAHSAPLTLVVQ